jgi:NADH:ubiquinone oxidoreductase subunit 6 (subunit J)
MRVIIFHLGAVFACAMAVWSITRRNAFAAILGLALSLGALGIASLAIGANALGVAQILVHAGGVFVLFLAGLLLADGRGAEAEGRAQGAEGRAQGAEGRAQGPPLLSFIGLGTALLLGVAIAVKFTPLTDLALGVAPLSWRELAGQVIAGGAPGEAFLAVALTGLLAAGTILGIRLATRAEEEGEPSAATESPEAKKVDG